MTREELQRLLDWYDKFETSKGDIEGIMKARQRLSLHCTTIAKELAQVETTHKLTYQERRISEAERFLEQEGTIAEREANAINKELRRKEAQAESAVKGYKILLDSYFKVLDAMASQINVMNKL